MTYTTEYTAFPNDEKRPRIHLIGNGDSNRLFNVRNEYRIVCNIPSHGYEYNAVSIIDPIVINHMRSDGIQFDVPVLCTKKILEESQRQGRTGHWFDVYGAPDPGRRWSSGHYAVHYHAPMADELHLWGCDSMWNGGYLSQMDARIPRPTRPNLNLHWIPRWQEIFSENTHCEFVIHAPKNSTIPDFGSNVRKEEH
jgi:hypothetical protein